MLEDLRFSWRALRQRPVLFTLAVATLTIGIGASTALYTVVNGVLVKPLPYRDTERLAVLWHVFGEGAQDLPAMHPLDFRDYAARSRMLEELTISTGRQAILGSADDPEIVQLGQVNDNFFTFLGVHPQLGRQFRPEDNVPGAPPVMMLSDELWRRRFGADPAAVGARVNLDGFSTEIVGVLPAGFRLELPAETYALRHSDVWRPARIDYKRQPPRNLTAYTVFARLAPGVSFPQAQEEMTQIANQLRAEVPEHAEARTRVKVIPFHRDVVKGHSSGLWMLLAAVLVLLAIACANVALLMLGRSTGRERELLVRIAMGGTRARIARLAFSECLIIAVIGGGIGLLLARASVSLLSARALAELPRLQEISVDVGVALFAVVVTTLSAVLFGLVPALRAARVDVAGGLRAGSTIGTHARGRHFREGLVVAQLALGLVLAIGAGLVVQSFRTLASSHPGFNADGVVTMRVATPGQGFANPAAFVSFHETLAERIRAVPGVAGVGAISLLPLSGQGPLQPFAYDEETALNWESVTADGLRITPGYLPAIGATFVAGRDFSDDDVRTGRRAIDDTLAARAFGSSAAAIGQTLQMERERTPASLSEVIGVVRHIRYHDLRRPMLPQIYQAGLFTQFSVAVRASGDAASLAPTVERAIESFRPGTAVQDVRLLSDIVEEALGPTLLAAALMTTFGVVALLLAAVGVYGAFSYYVAERMGDFAVRLALGASPSEIYRFVLARCLSMAATGLALGVIGAATFGRMGADLLYGVNAWDASIYIGAMVCLSTVALFAAGLPARRASRVDPKHWLTRVA
jgi:putative ABC transport system permease protein